MHRAQNSDSETHVNQSSRAEIRWKSLKFPFLKHPVHLSSENIVEKKTICIIQRTAALLPSLEMSTPWDWIQIPIDPKLDTTSADRQPLPLIHSMLPCLIDTKVSHRKSHSDHLDYPEHIDHPNLPELPELPDHTDHLHSCDAFSFSFFCLTFIRTECINLGLF